MENKKIKVIEFEDAWTPGGVEKYIIQLISNIDRDIYKPIIWTTQKKTTLYDGELKKNHIKFVTMKGVTAANPILRIFQSLGKFRKDLSSIDADVFHLHASNGVVLIYAYIAKKCGIRKVIVHSHSSDFGGGQRIIKEVGHKIGKLLFSKCADINLACSDKATEWLFTKNQIKNGNVRIVDYFVDTNRFRFDNNIREEYRNRYEIKDETVFLNVGRFHYQKNQLFLLELFKLISDSINAKLFLIGEGNLENDLRKRTKELGLENKVVFVGTTHHVERYMWMSDAFILPSLYEGNPITVTEAQAAGLPCFISNKVTNRAKITDESCFIDISDKCGCADYIVKFMKHYRGTFEERVEKSGFVKKMGHDVLSQIKEIEEIYSC